MDFGYDARTEELRGKLLAFMDSHVYPAEQIFAEQVAEAEAAGDIWQRPAVIDELKAEARRQGLWNLFLTVRKNKDQIGEIAEKHGAGLTNLQYAPLAEITGRSGAIAPEALNCAAPDTGNMEVLAEFGTAEQVERWLLPAAGRRDQVDVLHDRAGRGLVRRDEHRDQDRAATATST